MKWIKLFEDFKESDITIDDIINVIKSNGSIWSKSIKDYDEHITENPIKPIEIDDNGDISIEIDGQIYYTRLKYVYKIEF